jgi:hypothetical protein
MIETIIFLVMFVAFLFILIIIIAGKISCPYNLFIHLPLCTYYWFLDVIFTIIWLFFWLLSFFLIFIPIWVVFNVICIFYTPLCIDISPDDVCIDKKDFFLVIDTFYQLIMEERFLYRNDDDVDNCYCSDSLLKLFDPLTTEFKFLDDLMNSSSGNNLVALVIAFMILCVLYYTNS